MKTLDQRLSELLLDIYEAASNPDHWQVVLQKIAIETGSSKASMHVHEFGGPAGERHTRGSRLYSVGYDAATTKAYASYYAVQDPYVERLRELFPPGGPGGGVGTSSELITAANLRRTEFYADYGRPNGIFFVAWMLIEQTRRFASGMAVIRPESARQFTRKQTGVLKTITPHMQTAFRLQRLIDHATDNNKALLTSVAQFDIGVIALDGDNRIVNVSTPAKALLDARDGIRVSNGRLQASDPDEDIVLQRLLTSASRAWDNPHRSHSDTLRLTREHIDTRLQVVVFPFVSTVISSGFDVLLGEDRPRVLVFLSDPAAKQASREAVLCSLYKLKPAEARIANYLLQGYDLREAAAKTRYTYQTSKTALKKVMEQTETHGQPELMRLMLSLPGALDDAIT